MHSSSPQNTRKHPSKETPTNMQKPEDTHPETRYRTASHKAKAPHPLHLILINHVQVAKAYKKTSKRTLQKSAANAPKDSPYMFVV